MELLDQLRRILPSQRVLQDKPTLLAYENDAFPVQKRSPVAVVFPHTTEEVARIVRLCQDLEVPFLARGSGTGLSGGATAAAEGYLMIVLAGMKSLISLEAENRRARVQPGLLNLRLSEAAAPHGLHFAPDPSSQAASTLGGNLSENAGGPHCFRYGMMTDHVLGLTLVTPEGEIVELDRSSGPDLTGLITGHEGTFGIVTEILLRLTPAPQAIETWLASFDSMGAACACVSKIVRSGLTPSALEILDHLTIQAVEASTYAAGYPLEAEAVLLVEWEGLEESLAFEEPSIEEMLLSERPLSLESTRDPEQRLRLWKGRKGAFGAMGRVAPDIFVLDGVVPRSKLELALQGISAICERHEITLANVFHAGDGNLHPNLAFDGRDPDQKARAIQAGREILDYCVELGGSISGEHGVGLEKLNSMRTMFTEETLDLFSDIKRVIDPRHLCNPGKLLPTGGSCGEGASAHRPTLLEDGR